MAASLRSTRSVAKAVLSGTVSHIRRASDVEGVYGAASAGGAIIHGAGTVVLKNDKGAVLELSGRQTGLMVNADFSGLAITLKHFKNMLFRKTKVTMEYPEERRDKELPDYYRGAPALNWRLRAAASVVLPDWRSRAARFLASS